MNKKQLLKLPSLLLSGIGIMSAACVIALIILLATGIKDDLWQSKSPSRSGDEAIQKLAKTPDYGSFYLNSIVFTGDRTIAGLSYSGVLEGDVETKQVWRSEGDDLPLDNNLDIATVLCGEEKGLSIADAAALRRPDYIVITVGLNNGVAYCTKESFKNYYGSLIDAITATAPETRVMLQSVFPVSKNYEKNNNGIDVSKIKTANQWISELAYEKGVRYLHTYEALSDTDGYLKTNYDSGDGMTLSQAGYEAMALYIRTHGYQ